MTPKGKLLIIGGAEDLGDEAPMIEQNREADRYEILRELLPAAKHQRIEIITTGSQIPDRVKRIYKHAFHRVGYQNPGFMNIQDKIEAHEKQYLKRAEEAAGVFFTGGDQFRIATILGGTKIIKIIKQRYHEDKNFLIAGTSAGAMVMSFVMIAGGGLGETLIGKNLSTSSGLGIIQDCIIDTHFIKRGRFGRLAHAIIMNPDQLGIGLGENTALVIKDGTEAECRGSGMVVIIDGKNIRQTNISQAQSEEPIFVENLKVHLLVKCCRFSIKTRKLYKPAILTKKNK